MAIRTLPQRKEAAGPKSLPNLMQRQPTSFAVPFVCSLASAALLWLCHFPFAWGWLAWVALVPLLFLVRIDLSTKKVGWFAWLAGLVFYFPVLQWMRVADYRMYATWIGLSLYCSLFIPVGILLVRRLDRKTGLPLVLTCPAIWTALEYLRAHFLTGFPWYFLGHTQHDFPALTQIADIGGAYTVTFLVAGVNALIFEMLWKRLTKSNLSQLSGRSLLWQTLGVALVLAGTLGYGMVRLNQEDFIRGPRVALIQGNLDQRIRNSASEDGNQEAIRKMQIHFGELSILAALQDPKPDLIVWSETSYPAAWIEGPFGQPDPDTLESIQWDARQWGTTALLGLNSVVRPENGVKRNYNSALLVRSNGQIGPRYDKIHRVPFGEYVPFKDWLPLMNKLAPYDYDYGVQPGEQYTQFPLGNFHFGALICYEDTDPSLARQYAKGGEGEATADFLINISNDGWFDGTSEHEEHLAISRFRAIECRRAVARAVNMGVSAIIDGNGRVLQPRPVESPSGFKPAPVWESAWSKNNLPQLEIGRWTQFKKIAGVLIGTIPIDRRFSLYAHWGDWFPIGCWLFLFLGLIWSWRQSKTPENIP
jgi:apolipoprotein N-acyltransferase